MKVALVYDRVNKFGGAERLLLSLHRLFPEAPVFTLVYEPLTSDWAKDITVVPTFLNQIPFLRQWHEWLAPVAPLAFETLNLSPYDVVISVTSSDAKSVITKPHQLHICYCLTPNRYFWSGGGDYADDIKFKLIPSFLKEYFKYVDLVTSVRPDQYLSISNEVKNRVKKYYKRNSLVIYPPIEKEFYTKEPISIDSREYYLIVSRLVSYKKVDLAVSAFNQLKLPLMIVGIGSEMEKLKKTASSNITFVGSVDDHRLIEYYRHARAVIFPQVEDFGLVLIEAQACGTPVIAYAQGGALETVVHQKTGYLFKEQTVEALTSAIREFRKISFNPKICQENAKRFNYSLFSQKFSGEINRLWREHQLNFRLK